MRIVEKSLDILAFVWETDKVVEGIIKFQNFKPKIKSPTKVEHTRQNRTEPH